MSTLVIVEAVLREAGIPLTVRDIVRFAGARLPSRSNTPETVVARDLSLHIKQQQAGSRFIRTAPGRFTMRDLVAEVAVDASLAVAASAVAGPTPLTTYWRGAAPAGALPARPAASAAATAAAATSSTAESAVLAVSTAG